MRFLAFLPLLGLVFLGSPASAESLKPGDSLSISVMQDPKLDRQVLVDPSGQIAFPLAGHIHAAGMTPQALEQMIKQRLKPNYKDDDLDITVAVAGTTPMEEDLKPKIFITGEVARPAPMWCGNQRR